MPETENALAGIDYLKELESCKGNYDATIEALVTRYSPRLSAMKLVDIAKALHNNIFHLLLSTKPGSHDAMMAYLQGHDEKLLQIIKSLPADRNMTRNQQIRVVMYEQGEEQLPAVNKAMLRAPRI